MGVVSLMSHSAVKTNKESSQRGRESASVHSLNAKKKAIAFETAKKNMKLAAQQLDW
ncbi:hypothetical protein NFHSH190041_02500 [Shewanella sp. NFH-SH190041]|nr:hypothetical protein NFHSH190041_02500 [Shewanella sp. NFH-SH190041]